MPVVLDNLFSSIGRLFGLRFQLCTPPASASSSASSYSTSGTIETWHSDVSFYRVFDDDGDDSARQVAAFYLDPYARHGQKATGAWMETGRG